MVWSWGRGCWNGMIMWERMLKWYDHVEEDVEMVWSWGRGCWNGMFMRERMLKWYDHEGEDVEENRNSFYTNICHHHHHHHHHHHVPEGLGVFPVPWSSRRSWSLHLFLGRPVFLRPFVLYCSVCFGSQFVSILCICCSHFFWYCFISFVMFCAPVFCLIHWFFSLSTFVIPSKCLKNFICAASKRCSSLFFSNPKYLSKLLN